MGAYRHWGAAIQRGITGNGDVDEMDEPTDMEHQQVAPSPYGRWGMRRLYEYLRSMRNPYILQRGMNADFLDGKHASDLQLTVSADSTDGIDSPNLVAGTNITIAVSGSDITISAAGSGDISSGSNLTSGRVVKATGNKQIDTPVDLSMQYITVDAADDTVQLLAGPSKRIEIRSPDKIYFDVNGTNEMIVESGKVTIAGLLDPTGLELSPVAANPGGTAANTLWLDSGSGNTLKHGAQLVGIINGSPSANSIMYWNNGTGRLQDAGFAYTTLYRSGGTDVPIADGGTGASTADAAVQNLTNGATSRTPVLTDEVPFNDVGTGGGKTTPQALFNLINSLTAETAPVYNDKVPLYDASASQTDAVTIANLLGVGRSVVISYTGSGSSGKTVTLTGINRAHAILFMRDTDNAQTPVMGLPGGSTGTFRTQHTNGGAYFNVCSLDAPAAGTAQVLTLNTTDVAFNSAIAYKIVVIGTPT